MSTTLNPLPTFNADMDLNEACVEIMESQLGVCEIGSTNMGPAVNTFLRTAGSEPGNPWCASLVYWSVEQACHALGVADPLNPILNHAYVQSFVDWAKKMGYLITVDDDGNPSEELRRGDLFCAWHADLGRYAHIGGVREPLADKTFRTVEGNGSVNGSRDGTTVVSNIRPVNKKYVFIRFVR